MAKLEFLSAADEQRIVHRISALERASTGEVRVHLADKVSSEGIIADARKAFGALGMVNTAARNGVLLYIAPEAHKFAIIGDEGIHSKVGDGGWSHAAQTLEEHFKAGRFAEGIIAALGEVGAVLTREFPATKGSANPNELSNELSRS